MMTIGSLFSGIGGLDLGFAWAGLGPVLWQVEISDFCRHYLARYWPNADRSVTDVRAASASTLCPVDCIVGGFPCQDVSSAGKQAGLSAPRSGLWYEFHRIVGELRPRIVVVENVASGARKWLCVVRDGLHQLGYRTRAFALSAAECGAPHRRARVFVVGSLADTDSERKPESQRSFAEERGRAVDGGSQLANSSSKRLHGTGQATDQARRDKSTVQCFGTQRHRFAESPLGPRPDGLPDRLARWPAGRGAEQEAWEPPRTEAGVKQRAAMLRAVGNAVSPEQAYVIGRIVAEMALGPTPSEAA